MCNASNTLDENWRNMYTVMELTYNVTPEEYKRIQRMLTNLRLGLSLTNMLDRIHKLNFLITYG